MPPVDGPFLTAKRGPGLAAPSPRSPFREASVPAAPFLRKKGPLVFVMIPTGPVRQYCTRILFQMQVFYSKRPPMPAACRRPCAKSPLQNAKRRSPEGPRRLGKNCIDLIGTPKSAGPNPEADAYWFFILAKQSLQYTGRSSRGWKGTRATLPQAAQVASYMVRVPV